MRFRQRVLKYNTFQSAFQILCAIIPGAINNRLSRSPIPEGLAGMICNVYSTAGNSPQLPGERAHK